MDTWREWERKGCLWETLGRNGKVGYGKRCRKCGREKRSENWIGSGRGIENGVSGSEETRGFVLISVWQAKWQHVHVSERACDSDRMIRCIQ